MPYSNRELDEKFSDIKDQLDRIEVQTKTTNGKVAELQGWRFFMMGGLTVLTIVVVPILAWALWVLINIQGQVHNAVDQALSAYNIEK